MSVRGNRKVRLIVIAVLILIALALFVIIEPA